MNDPRISTVICGVVAAWLAYRIFSATELPSTFVNVLQWTFFVVALAGFGAGLARLMRGR
jgi:hypothetical protein